MTTTIDIARRAVLKAGTKQSKNEASSPQPAASSPPSDSASKSTTSSEDSLPSRLPSDTAKALSSAAAYALTQPDAESSQHTPTKMIQLPSLSELISPPEAHPEYHSIISQLKAKTEQRLQGDYDNVARSKPATPHTPDGAFGQRQPSPYSYTCLPSENVQQRPVNDSSTPVHPLKVVPRYDMGRTLPQLGKRDVASLVDVALSQCSSPAARDATFDLFNTQSKKTATSPEKYALRRLSNEEKEQQRASAAAQEHKQESIRRMSQRSCELYAQLGARRGAPKMFDSRLVPVPLPTHQCRGGQMNHPPAGFRNVSQATHNAKQGLLPQPPQTPRYVISCPKKADRPFYKLPVVKYVCPEDPRGFVEVYKCVIKDANIFVDVDSSFVHISGICKALGPDNKMTEQLLAVPELRSLCTVINEGDVQLHGIWAPFETAWAICTYMAYALRYALAPMFGDKFPSACLAPVDEGHGHLRMALVHHPDILGKRQISLLCQQGSNTQHETLDAANVQKSIHFQKSSRESSGTFKYSKRRSNTVCPPPVSTITATPEVQRSKTMSDAKSSADEDKSATMETSVSDYERKQAVNEYHAMQLISSKTTSIKRKRADSGTAQTVLGRPRKMRSGSPPSASYPRRSPLQLQYAGPHLAQAGLCNLGAPPHHQAQGISSDGNAHSEQRGQDGGQRGPGVYEQPPAHPKHLAGDDEQAPFLTSSPFAEPRTAPGKQSRHDNVTTHALPPPPSKGAIDMSNVAAAMSRGVQNTSAANAKMPPFEMSGDNLHAPYKQSPYGTRSILPPTPAQAKAHGQATVQANEVLTGRKVTASQLANDARPPYGIIPAFRATASKPAPAPANWRLDSRRLYDSYFATDKTDKKSSAKHAAAPRKPSSILHDSSTLPSLRPLHERPVQPQQLSSGANALPEHAAHFSSPRPSLTSLARMQEESWEKATRGHQQQPAMMAIPRPFMTDKRPEIMSSPLLGEGRLATGDLAQKAHMSSPLRPPTATGY